jgi:hypothetical protein
MNLNKLTSKSSVKKIKNNKRFIIEELNDREIIYNNSLNTKNNNDKDNGNTIRVYLISQAQKYLFDENINDSNLDSKKSIRTLSEESN